MNFPKIMMAVTLIISSLATTASAQAPATVNGQPASPQLVNAIRQAVNAEPSGWIWYDPVSGLIGEWGQPAAAQIQPGIPAPPLPENASNGVTGVYVNGRSLPLSTVQMLEHSYIMIVEGQYSMGPDLVMYKYSGAPGINFAAASQAYSQAQQAERQWCAMARARAQSVGPGEPVYLPEIGGGPNSVQVTMDRNGCIMANVQGTILSRCC